MARPLAVVVKADISAYQSAMRRAGAETNNFTRKMSHVGRAGMAMSRLGDTMTRRVTLPLLAIGAAAVKLAIDFDAAMSKIVGLVGISADEVDGMRDSVLQLAGETAKSPQELADALFAITSAGLRGSAAMDVLEASAKASAAGLGSTREIAEATTAAINTYGAENLEASYATDILVATARAGNFETTQFAGSLGRVLPFAKAANVSIEDLGGTIALLTRTNNDANLSITQSAALFRAFAAPTKQTIEALDKLGLSTTQVRDKLGKDGLVATLQFLDEALGGNRDKLRDILPDSNAFSAAIQILDADAAALEGTFGALGDAAGLTDSAFAAFAESAGFKSKQAFADLQASLIQVGDTLIPIVNQLIQFGAAVLSAFDGLPGGAKMAIIYFGLVLAAIGPLLSIGGRLMTTMALASSTLSTLAASAGPLAPAMNAAAAATGRFSLALGTLTKATFVVGALFALREVLGTIDDEIDKASLSELENQLLSLGESGKVTGETLKRVFAGLAEGGKPFDARQLSSDLKLLDDALAKLAARDPDAAAKAFEKIKEALEGQGATAAQVKEAFSDYGAALTEADTASRTAEGGLGDAEAAMAELGLETEETTSALQEFADAVKAQFDPLFAMIDAQQRSVEAQRELREAEEELTKARDSGDQEKITAAEDRLSKARVDGAKSIVDQQVAANQLKDALDAGTVSAEDAARQIIDMGVAQGWTKAQTMTMAAELGVATEVANELGRTDPTVDVKETGTRAAQNKIDLATLSAQRLGSQKPNVRVSETGGSRTRGTLSSVQQAAINAGRQKPNVQVRATDRASGIIAAIRARLAGLQSKTISITTVHKTLLSTPGALRPRQHGGPVRMGQAYVVGEKEPEVFIPDRDGMILPSVPARGYGTPAGGGGGGAGYIDNRTINITTGADPQQVVAALRRAGEIGIPITVRGRTL